MQPIPPHIVEMMTAVYPKIDLALCQLERHLAFYGFSPIANRHEIVHDLSLMLAMDDLESMSSIYYDPDDNVIFERRIYFDDFEPDEDQSSNEHDGTPLTDISRDIRTHSTPVVRRFGKTGYEQWLLDDWGDTVPDADTVVDEELGAKPAIESAESALRLRQSTLRLPK